MVAETSTAVKPLSRVFASMTKCISDYLYVIFYSIAVSTLLW